MSLHTHMYQKEWIYDLVICEKAKPPLNRRHSNSFFFLSRHSKLVTAPLRVAQWIDVKRLHHHRDRERSSFLLGIHVQAALQSCFGLGLLLDKPSSYSISCSMYLCQPVFLGIYQFPFHVFAFAFAPAPVPALVLFVFHFILFCRKSQPRFLWAYIVRRVSSWIFPYKQVLLFLYPCRVACLCTTCSTCACAFYVLHFPLYLDIRYLCVHPSRSQVRCPLRQPTLWRKLYVLIFNGKLLRAHSSLYIHTYRGDGVSRSRAIQTVNFNDTLEAIV